MSLSLLAIVSLDAACTQVLEGVVILFLRADVITAAGLVACAVSCQCWALREAAAGTFAVFDISNMPQILFLLAADVV